MADQIKNRGLTLIELLVVLAIVAVLIVAAIFAFRAQLARARDAKRKADLNKIQNALEDYLNDTGCYPEPEEIATESKICGQSFLPYLSALPCDPVNNDFHNYFYSYDQTEACKSWYKIYTKLENAEDPIITKVGCGDGCGPSGNYNYWVASTNMNQVAQIHPAEDWWPEIGGAGSSGPGASPTPTEGAAEPTATPPAGPTPTPSLPPGDYYGCFSGVCRRLLPGEDCSPKYLGYPNCDPAGVPLCGTPENPQNECL